MARKTIRIEGNPGMPEGDMLVAARPEGRSPRVLLSRASEDDLERILGYADIEAAAEVVLVVHPVDMGATRSALSKMVLTPPGSGPGGARVTTHIEGEPTPE